MGKRKRGTILLLLEFVGPSLQCCVVFGALNSRCAACNLCFAGAEKSTTPPAKAVESDQVATTATARRSRRIAAVRK